jgi:hypothetical protein
VIAFAGCIEPSLLVCGDRICPVDTICLDNAVCATPEAIEACTGLDDNAACHAMMGDGYCTHGVCEPNVCGDGLLTGIEQCDGSLVSLGCTDFGYYGGTTSCSPQCTIDRSGCAGRCGDGVVQADQEDCDGAPPEFGCTDLGYDYGALGCSSTCVATASKSCARFGWRKLGPIAGYPGAVVGDVGMYAILQLDAVEIHEALVSTHPGAYVALDARAGDVVAATTTTVERYHAGVWTTLGAPVLQAPIIEVTIATDGTAFLLAADTASCSIASYNGSSWTITNAPVGCSHLAATAGDDFAVAVDDSTVRWHFPSCVATVGDPCECMHPYPTPSAGVFAIVPSNGNLLAYANGSSITVTTIPKCGGGPGPISLGSSPGSRAVLSGTEVFAAQLVISSSFQVYRLGQNRVDTIDGPPTVTGEPPNLWATRDGVIYAEANGYIHRLNQLSVSHRSPPGETPVFPGKTALSLAPDGTFVECSQHVAITTTGTGNGYTQLPGFGCSNPAYPCCSAVWARSASVIYAEMAPTGTPELDVWNGSTWSPQTLAGIAIGNVTTLAGNASIVVAVRDSGDVIGRLTASWSVLAALPAGCTAASVGVAPDGTIYAGGGCAGPTAVIWRYTAGAWLEVARDATAASFGAMSIGRDGAVFASTGARIEIGINDTWTGSDVGAGLLAAVSATDAFASNGAAPTSVYHWDGSRWTPVNLASDFYYFTMAASATDLAVYGSQRVFSPVPAWESFLRSP